MNNDKKVLIVILCLVVIVMSVAFSVYSTAITVQGTTVVDSIWKVEFNKEESSCTSADISVEGLVATINASFTTPGESATCTLTVENKGTLDAKLNSIVKTETGNAPIIFTIEPTDEEIPARDVLTKNNGKEQITVNITFDESTTSQPEETTKSATIVAQYQQKLS